MKVGEPGFPVAVAECGCRILVRVGSSFEVGDYGFTKFIMIPSVALANEIPEDIVSPWYNGNVFVSLKDAALEPSSPMHHMAKLYSILSSQLDEHSVLFSGC